MVEGDGECEIVAGLTKEVKGLLMFTCASDASIRQLVDAIVGVVRPCGLSRFSFYVLLVDCYNNHRASCEQDVFLFEA